MKLLKAAAISEEAAALQFIKDAVAAQLLIGPKRPLLKFVEKADEIMVKPANEMSLSCGYRSYVAFHPNPTEAVQDRIACVRRFVNSISQYESDAARINLGHPTIDVRVGISFIFVKEQTFGLRTILGFKTGSRTGLGVLAVEHSATISEAHQFVSDFHFFLHDRKQGSAVEKVLFRITSD